MLPKGKTYCNHKKPLKKLIQRLWGRSRGTWILGLMLPKKFWKYFCSRAHSISRNWLTASIALLGAVDRHKTFCDTSSRSNSFCLLQNVPSPYSLMPRCTLHCRSDGEFLPSDRGRVCAAHDSNCGLCLIVITPWQFGPPARVVKELYSLTGCLSARGGYVHFSCNLSRSVLRIVALFCREVKPPAKDSHAQFLHCCKQRNRAFFLSVK